MCKLAKTPPRLEEARFIRAATLNKDIKQGIQHSSLLFDNNNRMVCLFSQYIYRSGPQGSADSRTRIIRPILPQVSDDAAGVADGGAIRTRVPSQGSMDQGTKQVHQFQKNNLLPYFEGSSLPSMAGLGSGRGLEW